MNSYCLTIRFSAPPESMTLLKMQIVDFFPLTEEEMRQEGIEITSFSVERLDENGKPVIAEGEDVAILSVEEQASLISQHDRG